MKRINPKVAPKSQEIAKEEVAATAQAMKNELENPIKIQRVFTLVGETRSELNRYIIIRVSYTKSEKEAETIVNAICKKMTEMDDKFKLVYKPVKNPEIDKEDKSYTDLISYEKVQGQMALQRQYVGKLMTRAMAALYK